MSVIPPSQPIFVEPRRKDEFLMAMNEYYENIKNPAIRGACFMAVCRGKVSVYSNISPYLFMHSPRKCCEDFNISESHEN